MDIIYCVSLALSITRNTQNSSLLHLSFAALIHRYASWKGARASMRHYIPNVERKHRCDLLETAALASTLTSMRHRTSSSSRKGISAQYPISDNGHGPCGIARRYIKHVPTSENLTTLAFWLRSSVVSVLNSLTTITEAPPPVLVI